MASSDVIERKEKLVIFGEKKKCQKALPDKSSNENPKSRWVGTLRTSPTPGPTPSPPPASSTSTIASGEAASNVGDTRGARGVEHGEKLEKE